MAWPAVLPDGEEIDRPELAQLIERLDDVVASTTVVLGAPGAGKSALLARLANRFAERGWPVLAIKGDLLDANIASEEDLRARLGLDALPSIILQRLAKFQPVLLVLDQLDALAGYLDLRTARLSILLSLVRRLSRIDNVHIVLSARTFEFQHDVRLKAVSAEALSLQLPSWSLVLKLLEARGVHARGWPADAQEVMRSPQALATYLQLEGHQASESFTSYQAMLDRLSMERVLAGEGGPRRGRLATEIAELMAGEESLWLASARFDDRVEDITLLVAAGVLTMLEGSLGFSHQTRFDYALARSFARDRERLSDYVLKRQTSLFLRPKLWAGLTYLRAVDVNAYHSDFEAIWSAPDLRRHLRLLLIEFLGHEAKPTDREALLLERALGLPGERWHAYRALSGSPGWFERFGRRFIADAMSESDEAADQMSGVLARAWPFASDQVVLLLQERWAPHPDHDGRAWTVLQNAPSWSEGALGVACTIVGRTDISHLLIDHMVGTIGVEQPEAALRFVRARLERELALARAEANEKAKAPKPTSSDLDAQVAWSLGQDPRSSIKKLIEQRQGWESLPALAELAPAAFLDILWPWFFECFEALKGWTGGRDGDLGFALGLDASFSFEEEHHEEVLPEPALLAALRTAADRLAETDPEAWLAWATRFSLLDLAAAQRLVAHSFARDPKRFAKSALAFLLEDQRRYVLGSIYDLTGTSSALVSAASPHWSEDEIAQFEAAVAAYRPAPPAGMTDPDQRRSWGRCVRRIQLALQRALPKHRLTAETRRRVQEEGRVFPESTLGVYVGDAAFIGSIMDAAKIARASDEDVVNAFRTVPDASGWDHPRSWMVGGNIQLSREFATFAKKDPARAVRLLCSLKPENGTRAAGYVLEAISEDSPPEQVLDLLRDVVGRGFDGEEFRSSTSRAIGRLVQRKAKIDDDIVDVLERWLAASHAGTPTADNSEAGSEDMDTGLEPADADPVDEGDSIHRSLLWGYSGFSVVSGGDYPVLETLTHVRLARGESDRLNDTLSAYLERRKDAKFWDGLLRFLPYLYPEDATRRAAFLERLFAKVPALLGSKAAAQVLANAHWWGADVVDAQLDRWRDADSRSARQAYGEIVAVAAITQPALSWAQTRLEALIEGKALEDARAGAALTAAHLWTDPKHRSSAAGLLTRLLASGGAGVWMAAFDVFRLVDELTPDLSTVSLLTVIADRLGDAPRLTATFVVEQLAKLLPHQALLVGRIAEGLIALWGTELGDIRTATEIAAPELVDLAVTLHRLGPETREIGTTLFEQLIEIDAYAARQTLDEIDSRFREQAPIPRVRLARRDAIRTRRGKRRNLP